MDIEHDLMTAGEVATFLRVHKRTLRRGVIDGRLPAPIAVGRRTLRWRRDDIQALRPVTSVERAQCE